MADFLTPTERSALMARVRGRDTRPELTLRKELHSLGLRFRVHRKVSAQLTTSFPPAP
ncbi:hypothetical protein [uncultured Pseudacidovorax sp.]|uniref:hypothetical protein n=1 Tax=uncultured Pseudacidovorax sp. TaxID=679313 RepID=UPI0025F750C5|nr:hypothetical protein [uncultured Pseudacidovorax sp.]